MAAPLRLTQVRPSRRWLAAAAIAVTAAAVGAVLGSPARALEAVRLLDRVFYDAFYRLRPADDRRDGPIVIVAVDDRSIEAMDADRKVGWPWPRRYWGEIVSYLDAAGARAIVFDLLFDRSSVYNTPAASDDQAFAEAIDAAATPTVLATHVRPDGSEWRLGPPVLRPLTGAVNAPDEGVIRSYAPLVHGRPSLALRALGHLGGPPPPDWAGSTFLLHYYGPHAGGGAGAGGGGGPATFRYVQAHKVVAAAGDPDAAADYGVSPGMFKDKVVFVATITAGTFDLKSSPLSPLYPGVEVHATALQNMLEGRRVAPAAPAARLALLLAACFAAAAGTVIPARVPLKVLGGTAGVLLVPAAAAALFLRPDVRWAPPAAALVAATLAAFAGVAWSYVTELRQRRLVLRALTQYVSRAVADELIRDPRKLSLGGDRREMTVMFTDIANFTSIAEGLDVEAVSRMLNFYLDQMSGVILDQDGTLDKYIGDAIMSFWNAPLGQPDHARRACRAALEMRRREQLVAGDLSRLAGAPVYSRIGINSGPMIVGNMGSSQKFNYSVLGDSVNLASRIEGANKMYGTRILLAQATADLVRDAFVLRKVDLLRVKGRREPMAIYELIAAGGAPPADVADLIARYEAALARYQAGAFDAAHDLLLALAGDFPQDGPTATLLARVRQLRDDPPAAGWDGVYVAKDK